MNTADQMLPALVQSARAAEAEGEWDTALQRYEQALERAAADGSVAGTCEILRAAGRVHYERGNYAEASAAFDAALARARSADLQDQVASALNCLAAVAQARGRLDVAESFYSEAGKFARELGDDRLGAMVDQNLGILANIRGALPMALMRYRSALERLRKLGDDRAAAWVLNNMGMAHVDLEEWGAAELSFAGAHELASQARDITTQGRIELNRAELYIRRQNFEAARECCARAIDTFSRIGSDWGLGETYKSYGILYRETGKPQLADVQFRLARRLAQSTENVLLEAEVESEFARVHLQLSRTPLAIKSLNRAYTLFDQLRARREINDVQRRLERIEQTYYQAIQLWGTTSAEAPETARASGRVPRLACRLGRAAGLAERELTWLRIGGLLHDVGNTQVPAEVLNKPARLTAEEFELIKHHTVAGDEMTAELDFPAEIRPIVRNHHEHWDGSGYPDGLKGEEIPLAARVLCIADVYDALRSDRSWRHAYSRDEALALMEEEAGRTFDPALWLRFREQVESDGDEDVAAPALAGSE